MLCLFQAVGNMIKEVGDAKIVHAYAAINMATYQFPPQFFMFMGGELGWGNDKLSKLDVANTGRGPNRE